MGTYTENLNLIKPDKVDQYNIDDFNSNFDKIDNFSKLTPARALTADKLTTGKRINGVNFDGTEDVITGLGLYSKDENYDATNIVYRYIDDILKIFRSKKDGNKGNDTSNTEYWEEVSLGGGMHNTFDVVMKDHILTFEESKGLVAFGDYAYKTGSAGTRYGYAGFYNKCLKEYNEAEDVALYTTRNFSIEDTSTDQSQLIFRENFNAGSCSSNVSNFTTTRYLLSNKTITGLEINKPFVVNFTTGSNVSTEQTIACFSADYNGFLLRLQSGKIHFWGSVNGTSWGISEKTGTSTLVAETTYTAEINWDGATYTVNLLREDGTITTEISVANANPLKINSKLKLGLSISDTLPFLGTINLVRNNECATYITDQWYSYNHITVKKHTNKHIFYDIADVEDIDYIYEKTRKAWLYGVDTVNERIRIVRNDAYFMSGDADEVGNGLEAGLPNITGRFTKLCASNATGSSPNGQGAFSSSSGNTDADGSGTGRTGIGIRFDASDSNTIYGNSDTVQTDAVKLMGYICVGNTETEVANTEVVEVTTTENDTVPLFTGMYFDFKPNNISWLAKDTTQSKSGKFYETTYNELVKCLNEVDNKYGIKVIDVADMVEGVDYSLYWKVDKVNMTFTTPSKWGLVSALTGTQRVLVNKKEPTETDSTWYNLYSDGWLEQGGQLIGSKNTLVFSIPYRDTNYNIQNSVSDQSPTDYAYAVCSWNDKTTNSVTLYCGYNKTVIDNSPYDWVTTGYAEIPSVEDYTENVYLYFKVGNAVANQELIDVGTLTETVNNKIDINSGYVDGQWVAKELLLSTATAVGNYELDLSDYLPNDDYCYEVMLSMRAGRSGSNSAKTYLSSSIVQNVFFHDSSANAYYTMTLANFPIGENKILTLSIKDNALAGAQLIAHAYRRLGKNK